MEFIFTDYMQQVCIDAIKEVVNVSFIYYSHIPAAVISLIIGIMVFIKNRDLVSKALLTLSVLFGVFIGLNLITWLSSDSEILMFSWSFFGIAISSIFIMCTYFSYLFIFKRDITTKFKFSTLLLVAPIFLLTPTKIAMESFNGVWCQPSEGINFIYYYYAFGVLASILSLLFLFIGNRKNKDIREKRKNLLMTLGVEAFIVMLFLSSFLASYLYEIGVVSTYNLEPYGLFGAVVFMGVLAYLIVKFKAFDIKLIGAQALVWALIILVGSEFFFVEGLTAQILVAITLILSAIVGLIIVRSVKKEIAQREELARANDNQQLLIRFITHQVKGFFTKSKMVFAAILEGDLGEVNEQVKKMSQDGLESDNKAVDMVQEVLNASSLRTGQMTYNLEETDFGAFVQSLADSFKEMATQKALQYEVNIPEGIKAKIDKLQMTQVIKNLIDNSVKYTLTGYVKVGLEVKGKNILFSIHDSGVGLTDGDKAKLFKEGGRGEESLKVNVNSTGYGLFIVKKIVEGHHGKIWAESQGRGHGSQFYFEIPTAA